MTGCVAVMLQSGAIKSLMTLQLNGDESGALMNFSIG